jgi:hypothetical protein
MIYGGERAEGFNSSSTDFMVGVQLAEPSEQKGVCSACVMRAMEAAYEVSCPLCHKTTYHNTEMCEACAKAKNACRFCGRAFASAAKK